MEVAAPSVTRWPSGGSQAWRLLLALAIAMLVCLDPYLSELVPRKWWAIVWLEDFPFRVTLAVVALATSVCAAWFVARKASDYRTLFIFVLIASAQLSGLKAGFIDPLDMLTLVVFVIWLAEQFLRPNTPVVMPAVMYFALALLLIDLPLMIRQGPVRFAVGFLGLAKVMLLAFMLVNILRTEVSLRLAVRVLIGVAIGSAVIGVVQSALYMVAGIKFSLIDEFGNADTFIKYTAFGPMLRASGLNATAQHLSGFLVIILPFVLMRFVSGNGGDRWKYGIVALLFLSGILLSWNYTAFIATAVVLGLAPFFFWPHRTIHFIFGAILFVLVLYYTGILEWLYQIYLNDNGASKGLGQRFTLMKIGFEKLTRDPWIGEGLREFAGYSGNFWHRPVHNAYIEAATELGLVGAFVFMAMLITLLTQLLLLARRAGPVALRVLKPTALGFIGLMCVMLGEPMLAHSNTWLFLGFAQSVVICYGAKRAGSFRNGLLPDK